EIVGRSILGVICTGRRDRLKSPKITSRMQPTATATGLLRPSRVKGKWVSPLCLLFGSREPSRRVDDQVDNSKSDWCRQISQNQLPCFSFVISLTRSA